VALLVLAILLAFALQYGAAPSIVERSPRRALVAFAFQYAIVERSSPLLCFAIWDSQKHSTLASKSKGGPAWPPLACVWKPQRHTP
jgi:hypothetical protein